jgi:glycogen synthase
MFGPADPVALFDACRRAAMAMADTARWSALRQRAMATDFSWSGPARDYVAAYRRASALLENDEQRV